MRFITTEIHDIKAAEMNVFAACSENVLRHLYEPDGGLFIAESPNVIERALRGGFKPVSVLVERNEAENADTLRVLELMLNTPDESVGEQIVRLYSADKEVMKGITGFPMTRGMLCAFRRPEMKSAEEICRGARRIAVLEDVMNPTNVGAIFRSAAALGMDALLLSSGCSDPYYRRAARVSMGTVFQIPWTYLGKGQQAEGRDGWVKWLETEGFYTAAMALTDNTVSIDDAGLKKHDRIAVVLGSEGPGLKEETIAACSTAVKIPMKHGADSLNVAAASAVIFYELTKA